MEVLPRRRDGGAVLIGTSGFFASGWYHAASLTLASTSRRAFYGGQVAMYRGAVLWNRLYLPNPSFMDKTGYHGEVVTLTSLYREVVSVDLLNNSHESGRNLAVRIALDTEDEDFADPKKVTNLSPEAARKLATNLISAADIAETAARGKQVLTGEQYSITIFTEDAAPYPTPSGDRSRCLVFERHEGDRGWSDLFVIEESQFGELRSLVEQAAKVLDSMPKTE
jgi:hypothetical protein